MKKLENPRPTTTMSHHQFVMSTRHHLLLWISTMTLATGIMKTGCTAFVPTTTPLQTGTSAATAAAGHQHQQHQHRHHRRRVSMMFQKPHPPETAPPKSKFEEIFSSSSNIFLSATTMNKDQGGGGGKADNSTDNSAAAGEKKLGGGGGIANLFKNALNLNSSGKKSSSKSHQQQPPSVVVDTPFFLYEQGQAVESSFESLEGGMNTGLQLSTTTATTTSPEELQKQKEEERKKTKTMVKQFTSSLSSTFEKVSTTDNVILAPLIQGKVEDSSQVSEQAIKGAILASVVLTAMAGKGAAMSGAAGLASAYVAITAGPVGQAVRALGGLTWGVANKGMVAYEKAAQQGKVDEALRTMAEYQLPETRDNIAAERALWDTRRPEYWQNQNELTRRSLLASRLTMEARQRPERAQKQNELTRRSLLAYRLTMERRQRTERATLQAIEEAHKLELATLQREQAKRTEESRLAAEEARLAMEASKLAEEMRIQQEKAAAVEEQKRLREAKRLEAETKRLEMEARALEQETQHLEQEAAEQARRAKELEAVEAAAEQDRLHKAEKAHLETEAKAKEEARLQAQEERLVENAKQAAEQARISANKKEAKAKEEESKLRTAEKMKSGDDDDIQGQFDEEDWEASIRAAQQSIDGNIAGLADSPSFVDDDAKADWDRASQKAQGLGKRRQRQQPDEDDDEDDDDVEEEMDLEAIAIAARKAVKAFEQQAQTAEKRKKAQRQQWEDEMVTDSEIDDDDVFFDDDVVDYSDLTVSELRGELKRRGLPASGGKKDMISRLEEDDMAEDLFDKDVDELEYFEMTVGELKEELQRRGLPTSGGKKDMVSRLEKDDLADDEDDAFDDENDFEAVAYVGGPFGSNINEAMNGMMAKGRGSSSPSREDFEGLARAAREAVEMFESGGETDKQDTDDWSTFTVVELKEELRNRGLSTKGKKTELVALLQNSDLELAAAEGEEDDLDNINPIGLAAREAFDSMVFAPASADDEPSDEALWEIEQDAIATEVANVADYDSMTIAQLKDELRGRGLRLSGKKNELIERLRASSSS